MTDEELAEYYTEFYGFGSDFNNITSYEANQAIEQACLAALKVDRPQWHYIKDGDLPKHENYVLVSNGKDWTKGFYKDKKWNIIHFVGLTKIIMWKEIELPNWDNDIFKEISYIDAETEIKKENEDE